MKKTYLLFTILFVSSFMAISQIYQTDELGLSAGVSYYLGDYNKIPFNKSSLSLGMFYRYNLDKRFAIRGGLNLIKTKGDKNSIPQIKKEWFIPKSFEQNIYDLNVVGEFNFIPYIACNPKYTFTPYVLAGVGIEYLQESNNEFQIAIPFGVGIKYNMSKSYTIAIETSFYKIFTDFVDYQYIDPTIKNIKHIGKQRNYHGNNDWYSIFGIKLAYCIKYPKKCYLFD